MDPKRRGLIIVVDAAYPFDAGKHDLGKNEKGFEMFADDPVHRGVVQGKAGREDSVGLLGIQTALRAYGEKVKKDCAADFKMRIGLNSGPVVVAAIGDDLLAIEHYMNTLRCTEKTNDLIFRSASHSTMALGYYYLNDLDSALKSVNEGRRIAEDLGGEFRLSYGYIAESLISFAQNDMAKALNAA
jgi:hypothetical protein